MTDFQPEGETEDPNKLRSAAVKALQSAARQDDPREFDRLTRHALRLLRRARAIRDGLRDRTGGTPALREDNGTAKTEEFLRSSRSRARLMDALCRFFS
jgi:hypothetical protein